MKVKPETLIRTCCACPSAWEGKSDDDRPVYIRFRGDNFRVYFGEINQSVDAMFSSDKYPPDNKFIIEGLTGEPLNGFLDNQEMHEILIKNNLSATPEHILENEPPFEFDPEAFEELMKLLASKKKNDQTT